ncbi:hypothetical protein ACFLW4_03285, partial [Chloroflexota bacterium]
SQGGESEKRSFIRSFVKLVKVKNGEAELKYSMPVLPDKATIDEDGVLPIVPYGVPWFTVPELLFEKKQLIPALQWLLISYCRPALFDNGYSST